MKRWLLPLLLLALAACSTAPKKSAPPAAQAGKPGTVAPASASTGGGCIGRYTPAQEDPSTRGDYTRGGLYKPDVADSTPEHVPDIGCIAEPAVVDAPRSPFGNKTPYTVLGKKYQVLDKPDGYVERGTASYYGQKFHGRLTSNREVYDMYAFTAAHKTLPLPSFARVTNLDNGKSVVVRVNDRGPFHDGRVIDLSYAAAVKLGIVARGTGNVEVRALTPGEAPASAVAANPAPSMPAASAMDELVGGLPPVAVAQAATPDASSSNLRYYARSKPAQASGADDFDAWLRAQGLQIVGGKVVRAPSAAGSANPATTIAAADAVPSAPRIAEAAVQPQAALAGSSLATARAPAVVLQVGSYSSRENADRALARLTAAGIASATLSGIDSNGRRLWRLRVGATDTEADALASRIAGLGFGLPQRVRE